MDASTLNSVTCTLKACYPDVFVFRVSCWSMHVSEISVEDTVKASMIVTWILSANSLHCATMMPQLTPAGFRASDAWNPILLCQIVHSLKKRKIILAVKGSSKAARFGTLKPRAVSLVIMKPWEPKLKEGVPKGHPKTLLPESCNVDKTFPLPVSSFADVW